MRGERDVTWLSLPSNRLWTFIPRWPARLQEFWSLENACPRQAASAAGRGLAGRPREVSPRQETRTERETRRAHDEQTTEALLSLSAEEFSRHDPAFFTPFLHPYLALIGHV